MVIPWLRVLAAQTEDQSSDSSTYIRAGPDPTFACKPNAKGGRDRRNTGACCLLRNTRSKFSERCALKGTKQNSDRGHRCPPLSVHMHGYGTHTLFSFLQSEKLAKPLLHSLDFRKQHLPEEEVLKEKFGNCMWVF